MDRFLAAVRDGDLQGLLDVLAPDVVIVADGGGLVAAARRPVEGAERVARFLLGGPASRTSRRRRSGSTAHPGLGSTSAASSTPPSSITVEDGRVTRIYAIRNPHKLAGLDGVAALTRS